MSAIARYVVDAVVVEHRSPSELARSHKVARSWIYKQLERFRKGGYAALEPRSRRPRSCPHQVEPKVQKLIVKLRCELAAAGHDAGPQTIHYHLGQKVPDPPSVATIWRILRRKGLVTPQPHKSRFRRRGRCRKSRTSTRDSRVAGLHQRLTRGV